MIRNRASSGIALALILAGLVGCSGGEEDPVTAEASYCEEVQQLSETMAAGQEFTLNSAIEDVKQWRVEVAAAVQDVRSSAGDLSDANTDALQAAFDDVTNAVEDLSNSSTLGEAYQSLSGVVTDLRTEVDAALERYDCSTATP